MSRYSPERQRDRRAVAIAKGFCSACVCRPATPNSRQCSLCQENARQRRARFKAAAVTTPSEGQWFVCCQIYGKRHRSGCLGATPGRASSAEQSAPRPGMGAVTTVE